MFLAAVQAMAIDKGKSLEINGKIKGYPNDPPVAECVYEYALYSCLIEEETDDTISVRIYDDEE